MPAFYDINSVYTPVRKLTNEEILRAIQVAITSEYESIKIYQQILSSTDNQSVHSVLNELLDDAMHHAGALLKLLYILSPEMARQYEIGAQRALEDINKA